MKIDNEYQKRFEKSPYLHSAAHALADELSVKLNDKNHFGAYLRMALKYNHSFLRKIAGEVLEQKAKNPGALFSFLVKKNSTKPEPTSNSTNV